MNRFKEIGFKPSHAEKYRDILLFPFTWAASEPPKQHGKVEELKAEVNFQVLHHRAVQQRGAELKQNL